MLLDRESAPRKAGPLGRCQTWTSRYQGGDKEAVQMETREDRYGVRAQVPCLSFPL